MPYTGEKATGDSLWRLLDNESVRQFQGAIQFRDPSGHHTFPPAIQPARGNNTVKRILAVDGSHITHQVQNGFPRAEAALFHAAVIAIDIEKLQSFEDNTIPSPSELRDLERVYTMSSVLPGPNVVGKEEGQDTPKRFFRSTLRKELDFKLDPDHESLLESFLAITKKRLGSVSTFKCPRGGL